MVKLKTHFDALRAADQRALQIKEEGDRRALELAREIQTYKDEQANELRSQIEAERRLYVTKHDLEQAIDRLTVLVQPLVRDYDNRVGKAQAVSMSTKIVVGAITTVGALLGIIVLLVGA